MSAITSEQGASFGMDEKEKKRPSSRVQNEAFSDDDDFVTTKRSRIGASTSTNKPKEKKEKANKKAKRVEEVENKENEPIEIAKEVSTVDLDLPKQRLFTLFKAFNSLASFVRQRNKGASFPFEAFQSSVEKQTGM